MGHRGVAEDHPKNDDARRRGAISGQSKLIVAIMICVARKPPGAAPSMKASAGQHFVRSIR
jgi:hypothetical protein